LLTRRASQAAIVDRRRCTLARSLGERSQADDLRGKSIRPRRRFRRRRRLCTARELSANRSASAVSSRLQLELQRKRRFPRSAARSARPSSLLARLPLSVFLSQA
jgi:hypothetical protein